MALAGYFLALSLAALFWLLYRRMLRSEWRERASEDESRWLRRRALDAEAEAERLRLASRPRPPAPPPAREPEPRRDRFELVELK